ncbi:hypothetical protein MNBD_GAMMA26-1026 [hydrothermal vent metagenome]|uniref:Integral membrane protein n=1 Tax=hydrothermal vent metagenome TaxID=652676 RepID=A0A3B1BFN6_9ZZZZ
MEFLIIKWVHILSAFLLFGTGLGSAFYKYFTDRTEDVAAIAVVNRLVVRADWLFTTPTIIIQPITGFWMMHILNLSIEAPWLWVSLALYLIAGACWLPVVVLQIRMRNLAEKCAAAQQPLSSEYHRMARTWLLLGIPAFAAMVAVVWLMVVKSI